MRFKILAALAVAALALMGAKLANGQELDPGPPAAPNPGTGPGAPPKPKPYWQKQDCKRSFSSEQFGKRLKVVYRYSVGGYGGDYHARAQVTGANRQALGQMARCAHTKRTSKLRKDKVQAERASWKFHRQIDRITPYGEWAIPTYIVMCESGGSYTVSNTSGSGASGAYQFMPSTWQSVGGGRYSYTAGSAPPYAQHIMAARLYASRGSQPWSCA